MTDRHTFTAELLRASSRGLASSAVGWMHANRPEALAQLPASFAEPRSDLEVRLLHLAAAVEFDRPPLIEHAASWYAVALHHRGVSSDYLVASLDAIDATCRLELPESSHGLIKRHIEAARAAAESADLDPEPELDPSTPHGRAACEFLLAVLEGRGDDAVRIVRQAQKAGMTHADIHDQILVPVQQETGRMWLAGEIQIADEHFGSTIVDRVLWDLHERLPLPPAGAPTVLTVGASGDLHGFGLRMIGQRLCADGLRVHELGPNMPAHDLAVALTDRHVDLVAISASMTLHLRAAADLVAAARSALGAGTPIVVGGQPFALVPDLGELMGADAAAGDGRSALAAVKRLLGRSGGVV